METSSQSFTNRSPYLFLRKELLSERDGNLFELACFVVLSHKLRKELLSERDGNLKIALAGTVLRMLRKELLSERDGNFANSSASSIISGISDLGRNYSLKEMETQLFLCRYRILVLALRKELLSERDGNVCSLCCQYYIY